MAGGKYYIDYCASFGSLYGNDAYSCFAFAHCVCLSLAAQCPNLTYYVDNYFNVTKWAGNKSLTLKNALVDAVNLKSEAIKSGILFHDWHGPTTQADFIGWHLDTEQMSVSITQERKDFMISYLEEWERKEVFSLKDLSSLVGLLIFISQVVGGLKSTIGILIIKRTNMHRSNSNTAALSKRLRWALSHILYILRRWKGVASIFDKTWEDNPDVTIYCDVAIDDNSLDPLEKGLLHSLQRNGIQSRGPLLSYMRQCAKSSSGQQEAKSSLYM
jgi:hypothetical protein